jgi:hypothetical protein
MAMPWEAQEPIEDVLLHAREICSMPISQELKFKMIAEEVLYEWRRVETHWSIGLKGLAKPKPPAFSRYFYTLLRLVKGRKGKPIQTWPASRYRAIASFITTELEPEMARRGLEISVFDYSPRRTRAKTPALLTELITPEDLPQAQIEDMT